MAFVIDSIEWLGKYLLVKGITFTVTHPLEALVITSALSNPRGRMIIAQIARHILAQTLKDAAFYGGLMYREAIKPAARAGATRLQQGAIAFAGSPAAIIGTTAVVGAVVGGAVTAKTVTEINRTHNVPSSSPVSMWSPFGGMQLGTVV